MACRQHLCKGKPFTRHGIEEDRSVHGNKNLKMENESRTSDKGRFYQCVGTYNPDAKSSEISSQRSTLRTVRVVIKDKQR